jgi:hypothetical protein
MWRSRNRAGFYSYDNRRGPRTLAVDQFINNKGRNHENND